MIWDRIRNLARLYMPVYKYESDNLKIIYAGYSSIKRNYYTRLFLNEKYHLSFSGMHWYSIIPGLLKSLNADMAVCELSRSTFSYFSDIGGNVLPVWAAIRINIDRPAEEIFNKNRSVTNFKDIIRRIRKYDLTYEILTDKESFDYFNDRFYKPFMKKRHGDEAFIEDLNIMWDMHENPKLIAIKENGKIIGMSFFRISGHILYLMRIGLLDGEEEYIRHGVIGSSYYFGILEGLKAGCTHIDLGGTRPFLTDRLTKYKLGLGAEFVQNLSPLKEYIWLGINRNSVAARDFLSENPFMFVSKDFTLTKYTVNHQGK
jgi:hypothetical protein